MDKRSVFKVSVVVPVYNVGKYLHRCMDSLLSQTLREIEVICVDDGSTDGSGDILDGYAKRDRRVLVIHQANVGAGPARNAGLDAAEGEYLFFCDPDDWCSRNMLKDMYLRAKRDDADVVFASNFICVGDDDRIVGRRRIAPSVTRKPFSPEKFSRTVFQLFPHVPWNKIVRNSFIKSLGLRFQSLPRSNDAYFVEALLAAASTVSAIDKAYYWHRVRRPGSLVSASDKNPLTGYVARDELRDFLKKNGMFEPYGVSWAFAVFVSAVKDMQAFTSGTALQRSYDEFRRRLLEDPDMKLLFEHPHFSRSRKEEYDAVVEDPDAKRFLLLVGLFLGALWASLAFAKFKMLKVQSK